MTEIQLQARAIFKKPHQAQPFFTELVPWQKCYNPQVFKLTKEQ